MLSSVGFRIQFIFYIPKKNQINSGSLETPGDMNASVSQLSLYKQDHENVSKSTPVFFAGVWENLSTL